MRVVGRPGETGVFAALNARTTAALSAAPAAISVAPARQMSIRGSDTNDIGMTAWRPKPTASAPARSTGGGAITPAVSGRGVFTAGSSGSVDRRIGVPRTDYAHAGLSRSYLLKRTYSCVRERPRRRAAFVLFQC